VGAKKRRGLKTATHKFNHNTFPTDRKRKSLKVTGKSEWDGNLLLTEFKEKWVEDEHEKALFPHSKT